MKKKSKSKDVKADCCSAYHNPYAAIAGAIIGPFIAIVALFAIFAPTRMSYLIYIAMAFAIMGIFFGFNASKKK
jgi:hypothetical protein